jgi:hypothetical protein
MELKTSALAWSRRVDLAMDPLAFEQLEEGLGQGALMAVAAPAAAAGQAPMRCPMAIRARDRMILSAA